MTSTMQLVNNVFSAMDFGNKPTPPAPKSHRLRINKGIKIEFRGATFTPTGVIDYPRPGDYYLSPLLNVIHTSNHASRKHLILVPA